MSFANLKSARGSSIDKLVNAAQAVTEKTETKSYADDRFWKPTQDNAGNGYAVIRFLPAKEGEDLPWVRYWDHGFKGPTGLWYIENSLTSINQADPVSESNGLLWNSGREEEETYDTRSSTDAGAFKEVEAEVARLLKEPQSLAVPLPGSLVSLLGSFTARYV